MNQRLVICVENEGYPASLEKRKLYEVIADAEAERQGHLRVKDESGEDYLYPKEYFLSINLPVSVEQAIIDAA